MATRPCRADADLKRIWQLLLPDTAFPGCRRMPTPLQAKAPHR
jgi:hypothetical protein